MVMAPCQEACPAGIDVPRYIRHLRDGRFAEALAVIRERIPFPFVCGSVCGHPCEGRCSRGFFDAPVAIRALKRVAAQWGGEPEVPPPSRATGKRVAIVGAGPCGLTAAYELALAGHGVTVLEALPEAGGLLRYGIPGYRLPRRLLEQDLAAIRCSGVTIRTGQRVASAAALRRQGYEAVLVATGAWMPLKLDIPGEDRGEVLEALSFLRSVSEGHPTRLGRRVLVVGDGNSAVDAARAARRLGAEVTQLYWLTEAEAAAAPEERAAARQEGVQVRLLTLPVRIDPGRVTCVRVTPGPPGPAGLPVPIPVPGSAFTLPADRIIVAIGQGSQAGGLGLPLDEQGRIRRDPATLATPIAGVFAGGDAATGPASLIEAIAQGHRAAAAMGRALGDGDMAGRETGKGEEEPGPLPEALPPGNGRVRAPLLSRRERLRGFAQVEQAYSRPAARREAGRCLSCDRRRYRVEIEAEACKDCGYCREVCGREVFGRAGDFNAGGYRPALVTAGERCVGCLRCLYVCPDLAITIRELACS